MGRFWRWLRGVQPPWCKPCLAREVYAPAVAVFGATRTWREGDQVMSEKSDLYVDGTPLCWDHVNRLEWRLRKEREEDEG